MDTEWKNQCKAELIQEIPDLFFHGDINGQVFLMRPLLVEDGKMWGIGMDGGNLAYPAGDGRLELTPLEDPDISAGLMEYLFDNENMSFSHFSYAALDRRIITAATFMMERGNGAFSPFQTVILRDSAGIFPCYFPLELEGRPIIAGKLCLMPDGGLFAAAGLRLVRYGPDGVLLYAANSEDDLPENDAVHLRNIEKLEQQGLSCPVEDSKGRLWIGREQYAECRTPGGEIISHHRLKGEICQLYRNDAGQMCAVTFQHKKYITRVYRFS